VLDSDTTNQQIVQGGLMLIAVAADQATASPPGSEELFSAPSSAVFAVRCLRRLERASDPFQRGHETLQASPGWPRVAWRERADAQAARCG
jgi:hypothetical protein